MEAMARNNEIRALRVEMNARFDEMDRRFDALERTIIQVSGGMIATFLAGSLGFIATQL